MARIYVDEINPATNPSVRVNNGLINNSSFTGTNNFTGTSNFTGNASFSGSVSLLNTYTYKNKFLNGDMRIDQRFLGASITPTDNTYTLDRYQARLSQSSRYTVQQNAAAVTPPVGFTNYLGITSSSAYTSLATDYFGIVQRIEANTISDWLMGTAGALTVTLSFWVRSSLTGLHSGSIKNSAENRSYIFTYTINQANTWEFESVTIPLDTVGTWTTTARTSGLMVTFNLGSGSNFVSTPNTWLSGNFYGATDSVRVVGTNAATLYITGLQLERGTQPTLFDYREFSVELFKCQRYLYAIQTIGFTNRLIGTGMTMSTTLGIVTIVLPNLMMGGNYSVAAPYTNMIFWDGGSSYTGTGAGSQSTFNDNDTLSIYTLPVTFSTATANRPCFVYVNAQNQRVTIQSELVTA